MAYIEHSPTITELRTLVKERQDCINSYIKEYSGVDYLYVDYNLYFEYVVIRIDGFEDCYIFKHIDGIADLVVKRSCSIDPSGEELTYEESINAKEAHKRVLKALRRAYLAFNYITDKEA